MESYQTVTDRISTPIYRLSLVREGAVEHRETVTEPAQIAAIVRPLVQDRDMTRRMKLACEAVGLRFLDHVVVTDTGYESATPAIA